MDRINKMNRKEILGGIGRGIPSIPLILFILFILFILSMHENMLNLFLSVA